MHTNHRFTMLLAGALLLGACAELPAGLETDVDAGLTAEQGTGQEVAATSAALAFDATLEASRGHGRGSLPTLEHAWQVALRAIAEAEGPEAAAAIRARHRSLLAEAKAAADAGNDERARELYEAAHQLQLETVVYAFGERVAVRLHGIVGERLRALDARADEAEANGADVTRVRALLRDAGALHLEAEAALRNGDALAALDADFAAADLLNEAASILG